MVMTKQSVLHWRILAAIAQLRGLGVASLSIWKSFPLRNRSITMITTATTLRGVLFCLHDFRDLPAGLLSSRGIGIFYFHSFFFPTLVLTTNMMKKKLATH